MEKIATAADKKHRPMMQQYYIVLRAFISTAHIVKQCG